MTYSSAGYLVDAVFGLFSLPHPILDHASCQLGVIESVDEDLIIQDVALGFLQQPQDLVLQFLYVRKGVMQASVVISGNTQIIDAYPAHNSAANLILAQH